MRSYTRTSKVRSGRLTEPPLRSYCRKRPPHLTFERLVARHHVEHHMGVEPTFSAWKADVLAIILMVHLCAAQPARAGYVPGVPLAQFIKRRHSVGGPAGPMRLAQMTRLELVHRLLDYSRFSKPLPYQLGLHLHKPVSRVSFVSHITGKRSSHFLIALAPCKRFELLELLHPTVFKTDPPPHYGNTAFLLALEVGLEPTLP